MTAHRQRRPAGRGSGDEPRVAARERAAEDAEDAEEAAEDLAQATRAVQVALDRRSGGAGSP